MYPGKPLKCRSVSGYDNIPNDRFTGSLAHHAGVANGRCVAEADIIRVARFGPRSDVCGLNVADRSPCHIWQVLARF